MPRKSSAIYDISQSQEAIDSFDQAIVSAGSNGTAVAAYAIYAAQTGKRVVLRECTISNETAAAVDVEFTHSGTGTRLRKVRVPAGTTAQFAFYLRSATSATINRTVTATYSSTEAVCIGYGIEIHPE